MIDHRGDCNAQPCTCGASIRAFLKREPVNFCHCGRKDPHGWHTWQRLGEGWFTCDGGQK